MADTDKTPEAPSAIEVGGASVPSQITINIGGASSAPAPQKPVDLSGYVRKAELPAAPDLSGYVRKEELPAAPDLSGLVRRTELDETLKGFTKASQTAAIADSIRATRAKAESTAATAEGIAKDIAATHAAVVDLTRQPRIVRLDTGAPVPAGTPRGALIFRTDKPLSSSDREFPPLNEWSLLNVTAEPDGYHLPGVGGTIVPKVDQMKPSDGQWEITLTYSWHGNFGEPEMTSYVYNGRTFEEFGVTKLDQGAKLADWTLKAGDRVTAKLTVTPREDGNATSLWAPWIEAPANGFVVHDVTVRRVA